MANVETRTKQLEIVQIHAAIIINDQMIKHQVDGFKRYLKAMLPMQCENAVLSIVEMFAAENLKDVEVKYPCNWWEALKEAHAPQMYLDCYPVKYHRVSVDIKAIWQGFKPDPAILQHGPFLPYVLQQVTDDSDEDT